MSLYVAIDNYAVVYLIITPSLLTNEKGVLPLLAYSSFASYELDHYLSIGLEARLIQTMSFVLWSKLTSLRCHLLFIPGVEYPIQISRIVLHPILIP